MEETKRGELRCTGWELDPGVCNNTVLSIGDVVRFRESFWGVMSVVARDGEGLNHVWGTCWEKESYSASDLSIGVASPRSARESFDVCDMIAKFPRRLRQWTWNKEGQREWIRLRFGPRCTTSFRLSAHHLTSSNSGSNSRLNTWLWDKITSRPSSVIFRGGATFHGIFEIWM